MSMKTTSIITALAGALVFNPLSVKGKELAKESHVSENVMRLTVFNNEKIVIEARKLADLYKDKPEEVRRSVLDFVRNFARWPQYFTPETVIRTIHNLSLDEVLSAADLYKDLPESDTTIAYVFRSIEEIALKCNEETVVKAAETADLYNKKPRSVKYVFDCLEETAIMCDEAKVIETLTLADLYKDEPEDIIIDIFYTLSTVLSHNRCEYEDILKLAEQYKGRHKAVINKVFSFLRDEMLNARKNPERIISLLDLFKDKPDEMIYEFFGTSYGDMVFQGYLLGSGADPESAYKREKILKQRIREYENNKKQTQ